MNQETEQVDYSALLTAIVNELRRLKMKMDMLDKKITDIEQHVFQLSYRSKR